MDIESTETSHEFTGRAGSEQGHRERRHLRVKMPRRWISYGPIPR